jgi:hypothetical protein
MWTRSRWNLLIIITLILISGFHSEILAQEKQDKKELADEYLKGKIMQKL